MLKVKFENIIFGTTFVGIEVFSENNLDKIKGIVVSKNNEGLTIDKNFEFNDFEEINAGNFSDLPVFLTIYTDKILIKETELTDKNDTLLVKKNFPNLNIEEFYFDIWRLDEKSFISIGRRTYIDKIIKLFEKKNNLKIASVHLGISNVKHIIDLISEEDILMNSKSFNKKSIVVALKEQSLPKVYPVKGINILSSQLLAFCSIIDFFGKYNKGSIDQLNTSLREAFFQKAFFKKYLMVFVFSLLIALLINFLFFNHYFNSFNEVSILDHTETINKNKMETLKKIIIDKENRVIELSQSNAQRISSILNEISKSIPPSILLNELQFQPVLKKGNSETMTEYYEKNIVVEGISTNHNAFNIWIEKLSLFSNIKKVVIVNYERDNEAISFKINLLIK